MTRIRFLSGLAALALSAAPAAAAVTKAAGLDEHPRVAWHERFQESRQGTEQTERFVGTYTVGADGALDLTQIAGDVRVTTGRGNEIRVEAIKRVRHRDASEAKRLLGLLRIEATQVGSRLEIRTVYPRVSGSRSLSASVDYTITVPATASVAAKTVSGDVVGHRGPWRGSRRNRQRRHRRGTARPTSRPPRPSPGTSAPATSARRRG